MKNNYKIIFFGTPDFRTGERIFQLLSRLIRQTGQSGVIIQTYNPDHPAIKLVVQKVNY